MIFWMDMPCPTFQEIEFYLLDHGWMADFVSSTRGTVWYDNEGGKLLLPYQIEEDEIPGHTRDIITELSLLERRSKAQVYLDILSTPHPEPIYNGPDDDYDDGRDFDEPYPEPEFAMTWMD